MPHVIKRLAIQTQAPILCRRRLLGYFEEKVAGRNIPTANRNCAVVIAKASFIVSDEKPMLI